MLQYRYTFLWLKLFLNDGVPQPKITVFFFSLHDSRCLPRPWNLPSGQQFCVSPNMFLGMILSSQRQEPKKKSSAPLS